MSGEFFLSEFKTYTLEGQNLCKRGSFLEGIALFEKALSEEINNSFIIAAISSHLGNAYYSLHNYSKAKDYHLQALELAKSNEDLSNEAIYCGNLCVTLKALGYLNDAIFYCNRHIEISSQMEDMASLAHAYYNKGNINYAWARKCCQSRAIQAGMSPNNVKDKEYLAMALNNYRDSLKLCTVNNDDTLRGRCMGNIGNVLYWLGDFDEAKRYQKDRLKMASDVNDVQAMRRAHSNLGNCSLYLKKYQEAIHHYEQCVTLSREIGDLMMESRAYFNIGNVYSTSENFQMASKFYRHHLKVSQQYRDKDDEARCWLGLWDAYERNGEPDKASECRDNYLKLTNKDVRYSSDDEDDLCGLLNKMQSMRLNDQRHPCLPINNKSNSHLETSPGLKNKRKKERDSDFEDFFDRVAKFQRNRIDSQRSLPPSESQVFTTTTTPIPSPTSDNIENDAKFSCFLTDLQRNNGLDDQRIEISRNKRRSKRPKCFEARTKK